MPARRHDLVILGPGRQPALRHARAPRDFAWSHFQPRPVVADAGAPVARRDAGCTAPTSPAPRTPDASTAPSTVPSATARRPGCPAHRPAETADRPGDAGRQSIHVSGVESADLLLNAIEEILLVPPPRGPAPVPPRRNRGCRRHSRRPRGAAHRDVARGRCGDVAVALRPPITAATPDARRWQRVRDERLALAVQLLRTTDLSVAQVAGAVGYARSRSTSAGCSAAPRRGAVGVRRGRRRQSPVPMNRPRPTGPADTPAECAPWRPGLGSN